MIITQYKPEKEILELLSGRKRIFIVGCGSCAEQCHTGGEEDVKKMADFLKKNGKDVTGWNVPDETCNIPLVKRELRKFDSELEKSDAVLVMACGSGVSAVKEGTVLRVFPCLNTISLGNTIRQRNFAGTCSLCGDCVLGVTAGICPVTLCPKGMLNGPCGGTGNGKCEVNKDNDCIWISIYDRLELYKSAGSLKKIQEPKDYSKQIRGAKISQ